MGIVGTGIGGNQPPIVVPGTNIDNTVRVDGRGIGIAELHIAAGSRHLNMRIHAVGTLLDQSRGSRIRLVDTIDVDITVSGRIAMTARLDDLIPHQIKVDIMDIWIVCHIDGVDKDTIGVPDGETLVGRWVATGRTTADIGIGDVGEVVIIDGEELFAAAPPTDKIMRQVATVGIGLAEILHVLGHLVWVGGEFPSEFFTFGSSDLGAVAGTHAVVIDEVGIERRNEEAVFGLIFNRKPEWIGVESPS